MAESGTSLDELFELLTNSRRRYVLYHLDQTMNTVVALDELTDQLVRWEETTEGTDAHRRDVRISLHHNHLPRLMEAGLVDYDARSRTVRNWEDPAIMDWAQTDIDELPRLRALFFTSATG